jgi:hypothetical protein
MAREKYLIWTIWVCGLAAGPQKGVWSRGLKNDRPRPGVDDYRNGDAFPEIRNTDPLDFDIQSSLGRLFVPLPLSITGCSSARYGYEQSILFAFAMNGDRPISQVAFKTARLDMIIEISFLSNFFRI